jgi:hypothetical protein
VGAWVTLPLPEPELAADTGAFAVGATWIDPVREPDWPLPPALAALGPEIACFGHGEPITGGAAAGFRAATDVQ